MIGDLSVLGVCGWSGSGKTTLIEGILPYLLQHKLKVAVIKHDVHGIDIDRPGKDSDRLFRAGADVFLQGDEIFFRLHQDHVMDIDALLELLQRTWNYDLILVEGHKQTPLPKVWLLNAGEEEAPADIANVLISLPKDDRRLGKMKDFLKEYIIEGSGEKNSASLSEEKRKLVEDRLLGMAKDSRVMCANAMAIAESLGISCRAVGRVADGLKIRISRCQLGCF